jgi:predicted nicotinamide N-methyase
LSQPQLPDSDAAQQKNYVTYTSPTSLEDPGGGNGSSSSSTGNGHPSPASDLGTVTLLENRALLASSGTTGLRTWEAALHLATFLVSEEGETWVKGRNVLELGAGTGFISILCAKALSASFVLATDGSGDVVDALGENVFLNGLEGSKTIDTAVLKWGHALIEGVLNGHDEHRKFDLILGADVVSVT